ncbi:MAG: M28 family peptidase [Candidatus Zixiibacteriota bacterium]
MFTKLLQSVFYGAVLLFIYVIAIPEMARAVSDDLPDLYKVMVESRIDAERLAQSGAEPVLKITGGYLVLVKSGGAEELAATGLKYSLIRTGVDRCRLAIDIRRDNINIEKYPLIFEENGVRILEVDPEDFYQPGEPPGLSPLLTENINIIYEEPTALKRMIPAEAADLDSLIALIRADSLQAYVQALQAFPPRLTGSQADYDSRDWIYNKFVKFGYDSVMLDTFTYSSSQVHNIIAVKPGSLYPDHYVVIGAHKDAVSVSPGADDNGSGTAGVLEIARVLKDIDTKMTFIFILFDGEEQGLNGAWHYANAAAAAGDSIVVMLNMDMIGFMNNDNDVTLYHSSDITYANLWIDLADSLTAVNLTGHLSGTSAASDHYPFQQNGYDVVFSIEYNFSSVYHTYRDSTSYMDFSYMARIVKGMLAAGYVINDTYTPTPGLQFVYPDGLPQVLTPGLDATITVQVVGSSGGNPVSGSGILYYRPVGQATVSTPMTLIGDNLYEAVIPAQQCEAESIEYWFSAEEATTGIVYDPPVTGFYSAVVATETVIAFVDNFETDKGWTISGGLWSRGTPTGGGGEYGSPDPSGAYSGSNVFGYNLGGDYTNSMPERHLTSPAIDCTDMSDVKLKFQRWLGVEQPLYDHAYIRLSTNGTAWTTIWTNSEEVADNSWMTMEYDISSLADNQPVVYIRFTMGTTDGSWVYCGWNIDDLEVIGYRCGYTELVITTESLPDWTVGYAYSQQLTAGGGFGTLTWSDKNNDLIGTGLALSASGLLSGTPTTPGPVSFIAQVTDENMNGDEKALAFGINAMLEITTESLSAGVEGEAYSLQFTCAGGTGPITWTDMNNDLNGTGLSLSATGLLSGTPLHWASINFTARAADVVGAVDEKAFVLYIAPSYLCGDANNDETVNLLDVTFLINYIYRSGPEPSPLDAGDPDGNGAINILDVTHLISYLYKDGAAPICP